MKFTLSWLKRHLDTNASLEEISETLTDIGLELEELKDSGAEFSAFKVAYVEKAEQHPDADKLQLCTVKSAEGTFQVVCGAPNARQGMKGIFAPEGSYIPGLDFVLKKAKIRGVESCGMLVSEREMCLSEEHDGIIEVDDSYEIGTPMADIFGLNDPVFDIALTPNRADCAGVRGIARDLAAAGLGALKPLEHKTEDGAFKSPVNIQIEDNDGCPLFLGRYIKGVKNVPSPDWLQLLLKSVGLRPISALVDITNFMSLDHARPLHVYDADKLKGDIIVRETKKGEKLDALDDKSYEAIQGAVGVYDDSGLIGFGGVVGGKPTGCTEETTNVFVEAAYFKPERIARTGRDMGIESDARYRFERGVDPEFTFTGMDVATQLILEICGGEASHIVQAGEKPNWQRSYKYDPDYLTQLIGHKVPDNEQTRILTSLGFEIEGKSSNLKVSPPSWRGDILGKADLTEEIIRIIGFDKIPSVSVTHNGAVPCSAETPLLTRTRQARNALTARGLNECVTWSFLGHKQAQTFGINDNNQLKSLTLKNPISSELDVMRPSILPNLIEAAGKNADQGYADVALCEIGPTFQSVKPEGQSIVAAGVRAGNTGSRHWSGNVRTVDTYDAKADALSALAACGAPAANAQISNDAPEYYHPGRSGSIRLGKNVLAYFGELHPGILEDMGIKTPLIGFEVFLENIPEPRKKSGTEKPLVKLEPLQPLSRDFAFLVDDNIAAKDIINSAISADKKLITKAEIFDIYKGNNIEDGKKSVALAITIQPSGETLTDKDLEALSEKVVQQVCKKTGGILRG